VKNGLEQAISRGVAYAPTPTWCGARPACPTSASPASSPRPCTPAPASCCPTTARRPSTGRRTSTTSIASFQEELSALGYKFQFITLAGIHSNWYNTFKFAHAYARGEGMKHYVEMVQEPEFAAREQGYTFVSHQQEVGAGYFDDVTTVIQGGSSSSRR
jgi:isocitrate lyase